MSGITHRAFATCVDTGKIYDLALQDTDFFGNKPQERPQVFQVRVYLDYIDCCGNAQARNTPHTPHLAFCVERQTLINLKLLPAYDNRRDTQPPEENKEIPAEQLFLDFLAKLGIHPTEE